MLALYFSASLGIAAICGLPLLEWRLLHADGPRFLLDFLAAGELNGRAFVRILRGLLYFFGSERRSGDVTDCPSHELAGRPQEDIADETHRLISLLLRCRGNVISSGRAVWLVG